MRPAELHSQSAEENCPTENVSSLRSVKGATLPCAAYAAIPCGLAVCKQHNIYEDNVSGKLSDDRFAKMSRRYEDEQKEISEKIRALRAEMDKLSSKSVTADMFISTVRKYTRAKVLTPRMLNELIDHIEVHQAEKIDGIWEQHLVIHYNCVGVIFIPDVFPLPAPQVSVNTRKGVVVNYAPGQLAV